MQTPAPAPAARRFVFSLWPLLLPLLLLIPGLAGFPYPRAQEIYSDITMQHYPYAIYLRQALFEHGEAPLWYALLFSGNPFAANPLAGLWYPPGWLALILPLPLGFNLLVIAHLLWGGVGTALLLRSEGLGRRAAVFGGLAFTALPKLFAHYGAGHLTLMYAVPWTPWLLLASRAGLRQDGLRCWMAQITWEAPLLALIFLADPRWCVLAALLWWGYRLWGAFPAAPGERREPLPARLAGLAAQTGLAALLAAPLALPLLEFTRLSTRASMSPEEALAFSLPWARLLGLVVPDFQGFHEYMLYAGQGLLLLAALALILRPDRARARFWLAVCVGSLLFALGDHLPLAGWLTRLPLFNLLRVPGRALFLTGFALIMLGAGGLQAVLEGVSARRVRLAGLFLTGYAAGLLALAAGVWYLLRELPLNFGWAAVLALAASAWLGLGLAGRASPRLWIAGLVTLCLLDWAGVDRSLFDVRPPGQVLAEKAAMAGRIKELEALEGPFRVYSPSYSLPQQTAAVHGLQLADGVDPLHLSSYAGFMERATGVPQKGYSVTLPPFANGDPRSANQAYQPNPELLGLLNVHIVASEFALDVDGLTFEGMDETTYVYRNARARPRAWVIPDAPASEADARPVEILSYEPNRLSLAAVGPGLLVLSEVAYPGWLAAVDGQPAPVETYMGLLRAVRIGPGLRRVGFEFRPRLVFLGLAIGLLCWSLWAALAWLKWRRPRGG